QAVGNSTEGVSCRTVHVSPVSAPTPHQGARIQLSVCHKLCYAIGGAPYQITGSALGFFLQIYLLDVAQLDPFCTSIILFMGRAWDAVTDPTIGFLVSRSRWTRIGRMMPWIVLSTPLAVLSYFLVWWVPPFEQGKVLWYLVFLCLFQTLQTCFHVPYSALTMFISSEQRERDSATAYRMTMEVLGTVVGTAIQGQIVGGANAFCKAQVVDEPGVFNASASPAGADANVSHACLDYTKQAYMVASGVTCAIYVLCAVVLLLGTRPEIPSPSAKPLSFYRGLKLVMGHGPYATLVMGFLFTSLAFMLLEGNIALFCTYSLSLAGDYQNILLVIMLSATLSIPLWHRFLIRFGKKTAVYVGVTWAVPFMVLIACVQSSLLVAYLCSVAAGASVAVAFLLPWSMLPDVVDDFRVKNPELQGHEAIFYSSYVFFTKFASGVSLGVSTLSLSFSGYVTGSSVQPPLVDFTLRILVSPVPIVLIFVGLLIFRLYPIDEQRRQGNRKLLRELRNKQPDSETDSMETGTVV
uniref:MFSD2 lysolipid transporter A, lysophospholipid n=1 Tax=Scleropages formosus TaxID=113540 RepID=A0A8C9VRG9_SCLFO